MVVVKAQIHAGGRGKGGGVKVVKNADEAEAAAKNMLGMKLVTYQTGPDGQVVSRVLIEQGLKIKRELYLAILIDRSTEKPVLMVSQEGGVEIEKVRLLGLRPADERRVLGGNVLRLIERRAP